MIHSFFNFIINVFRSIGAWIETNSDLLTAAATVAIAAFTLTLWRATVRLWKVSQKQSKHMETSIAVAKASADAATRTHETMKDTAERQLRAYLSFTPNNISVFSPTILANIQFTILNHGQTPAYNVTNSALIEILPYPLPDSHQLPSVPIPPNMTSVLHPAATFTGFVRATRPFSKIETKQVVTNDGFRIYIFGLIKYKDAFGKNRQTKFCWSVLGDDNLAVCAKGVPPKSLVPIRFQPNKEHNEAD